MKHRTFSPTPFLCLCLLLSLGPGCASESEEPPPSAVAAPVISPGTGTYSAALDVAITTATADATIRYTTDGSTPTETAGTVYAAPVRVADSGTVKAVAYRTGWTTSPVTTAQFTIAPLVAAPTFNPPAGTYIPAQDVVIATTTAGAAIRYTTDGSTPTATNGTLYTDPVPVAASLTLKAVAYRAGWTTSPVTSGQYVIGLPAVAPAFDPGPGAYYDPQDVSLSTSTPGAAIRYTTDGSTPTETVGTPYTAPVHVATNTTLKAVAYRDGWRTSPVTSGDYAIGPDVSAPAFSPAPGSYSSAQSVVITTATPGSSIRYTTDGSTPTDSVGTLYSAPVPVSSSLTLRAVAYRSGWTTSSVISGDYTITGAVAAPEFSVAPGTYSTAKPVAITSATSGATIRYTTDGSTPTVTVGTVYASPVPVDRTLTLKAVAYRSGWTTSAVTTGEYKRVAIAAGIFHTILAKADGSVWTWGGNYEGQIGDGTTTSRAEPVRITALSGVVDAAAGYYHSVALGSDGTVFAWGRNFFGQLGDGTTTQRLGPVEILDISGVTAVAAGEGSTYALKSDGTVWAWGHNNEGQLGDGTKTDRYSPVQVQGLTNVISIAAGEVHALALKSDGTVWAWGNNLFGTLGDGTTNPALSPVRATSLSGMTAIAANGYHSAAVKSDGTLWCWGSGLYGELGIGDRPQIWPTPTPATGVAGASAVEAGSNHTVVLIDDGTLRACGLNVYGQLGDGTNNDRSTAVTVSGISAVVALGASLVHSVAITSDGTVWAWGHNSDYQLGDGTTTDRNAPVQVIR
jgi:alpha-tubulin suppressor-like RCC1 family protein